MVTVTVSIGIASTPTYGESVEALFAAADRALYTAKARGRNTVAVAGEPTSETTPQLRLERFVGRTKELRSLVRHLDGATRGDPRVVAIVGEAGIGKTALVRQLEPEARLRAGSFVIGRCCEADVKPPYGPWADVLESLRALGIAPECAWRELPRIVRSLAPAGDVTETAVSKYAIFDEITQFLKLAAAVRPLTIVLDDMQWADSATWDVLEHLLLHLAQDRILVCLTIRTEDAATIAPRQRRLSRDDRYHELRVPRLSANDLRQWMEAVFHQGDLDNELPAFVDRYTEGNPLVIVQVLRSLADEGAVWYAGTRWEWRPVAEIRLPVGVRDLLSRRLAHLSPKARHILGAAAVLGRTFEVDTALEAGGCTEDDLLDAIDEGVTAHVIARVANLTEDRYSFTHGLLAEAVRATVNPRRLRRIHARVARTMARRTPDSHAEIAAHYASADCGDEAFRHAMLGARHAMAMYAGEDARSFIELALRYATSRTQRLEGYTLAIQVAEIMGRYAEGEQHCNVILADATTPAEQRLPIQRARERLRALQGTPPRDTLVTCSGLLAQAEQQRNATERVQLLNMLAVVHGRLGDWGSAQRLARESVAAARALGDERLHADALLRLGSGLLESSPALALCEYERALELYARLDDRYGQARSYINMGVAQSRDGNLDAAEESYARALALGQPAHAPDLAGLATLNLGVLYVRRGRFDEAAGRFNEALRLFETVKSEIHRLAARYNLARLELECDRPRNALPLFIDVVTLAVQLGVEDVEIGARAGVGLSFLALGDMSAGGRALAEASAPLSNRRDWWFQGRELVEALTVRAALAAGDVARAASAFADGVARAEEWDPYAALWLVAECAPDLTRHGRPESDAAITRLASAAARLRFGPVVERFSALVAQREQRPGAASA